MKNTLLIFLGLCLGLCIALVPATALAELIVNGVKVTPAMQMAGNVDFANNLALNIGNAATDFTAGGLTAPYITATNLAVAGDSILNGNIQFVAGTTQYIYHAIDARSMGIRTTGSGQINLQLDTGTGKVTIGSSTNRVGANIFGTTVISGNTTVTGTLTATGDIAAGGGRTAVYEFSDITQVGITATNMSRAGHYDVFTATMPFAGSILAIAADFGAPVTAGTAWFTPTVGGPSVAVSSGTGNYATAAKDAQTFAAGAAILVQYTSSADFAGGGARVVVGLTVEY